MGLTFELTDTLSGSLVNYSAFRGDLARPCGRVPNGARRVVAGHSWTWVDSVGVGADYALDIRNSVSPKPNPLDCSRNPDTFAVQQFVFQLRTGLRLLRVGRKIEMHLSTFANYASTGSGLRQFPRST